MIGRWPGSEAAAAVSPSRGESECRLPAASDVSVTKSALCVVDRDDGKITSRPRFRPSLMPSRRPWNRSPAVVGHEAGSMAPWLHRELVKRGLPMMVVCPTSTPATSVIALSGPVGRMPTLRPKSEARGRGLEVVLWARATEFTSMIAAATRSSLAIAPNYINQ